MKNEISIIGLSGLPRSGKDSLAKFFIEDGGYFGVSLGDIVRDNSRLRHQHEADPISVVNMTETANWLRSTNGPDFALKQALQQFEAALAAGKDYSGLIVFSVRAPVEADFVIDHGGELIWVETSDEIRYHRAMKYLRQGEVELTLEQFKAQEDEQWKPQPGIPAAVQMNISYVKSKATIVFENNIDDSQLFEQNAKKLIQKLKTQ